MINPTSDRIAVKRDDLHKKTESGLFIPTEQNEKANTGIVVAIGTGRYTQEGVLIPITVAVGDKVCFHKYAGHEITVEQTTYIILREEEIFGVLK